MNAEENTPYYDSKFVIRSLSVYPIIKVFFFTLEFQELME